MPIDQARFNMIEQQIRPWNVLDTEVLDLLAAVKREDFAPATLRALAFADTELPLTTPAEDAMRLGQCMLSPRVEARMLQDLRVQSTDRVLEVGTGSGFFAALLGRRAHSVLTVEIDPALAKRASQTLRQAGANNVTVRQADGAQAPLSDGPFDVIVLSGSVAEVPQALLEQLTVGGRLGTIVGDEPIMRAAIITRTSATQFSTTYPWDIVAPRLQNFPQPSHFQF